MPNFKTKPRVADREISFIEGKISTLFPLSTRISPSEEEKMTLHLAVHAPPSRVLLSPGVESPLIFPDPQMSMRVNQHFKALVFKNEGNYPRLSSSL